MIEAFAVNLGSQQKHKSLGDQTVTKQTYLRILETQQALNTAVPIGGWVGTGRATTKGILSWKLLGCTIHQPPALPPHCPTGSPVLIEICGAVHARDAHVTPRALSKLKGSRTGHDAAALHDEGWSATFVFRRTSCVAGGLQWCLRVKAKNPGP